MNIEYVRELESLYDVLSEDFFKIKEELPVLIEKQLSYLLPRSEELARIESEHEAVCNYLKAEEGIKTPFRLTKLGRQKDHEKGTRYFLRRGYGGSNHYMFGDIEVYKYGKLESSDYLKVDDKSIAESLEILCDKAFYSNLFQKQTGVEKYESPKEFWDHAILNSKENYMLMINKILLLRINRETVLNFSSSSTAKELFLKTKERIIQSISYEQREILEDIEYYKKDVSQLEKYFEARKLLGFD